MQTIKNQGGKVLLPLLVAAVLLLGCRPPGVRALLKGKNLLEEGKFEQAAGQLRAATELLPTNAYAFNYLGLALQQAGQPIEAERAYYRALALNHELVEARYNLGCLFLAENKLEQAKSELTAFTLRRLNAPEGWLKLGTAQLRSREPLAAERSFNEALRLKPQDPEALTGVGLARVQRNRPVEAVQCFSNALKQQPDYAPALLNLAIVAQENLKDRQLALRHYRLYTSLKPRPEQSAAVQKIVRQLEQELAPPAIPAAASNTPLVPKSSNSSPAKPTTAARPAPAPKQVSLVPSNVSPAGNAEKTTAATKTHPSDEVTKPAVSASGFRSQTNPSLPKAAETAAATKPPPAATSIPQAPLEVVEVPSELVFKAVQDAPAPARTASNPLPTVSPTGSAATPAAVAGSPKPVKRSLLSKLNPARIFTGAETPPPAAPQPSPAASADLAKARDPSKQPAEPTEGSFARYKYNSPPKPASGDRSAAERAYAQGVQAKQAQRLPEAIQAYRRATQLDPTYFDAYYNLGVATAEAGNLQSALVVYEQALAIRPDALDARYNFALALKQAGYPLDALNELQKILALYPNESRAHLALGNLYAQQLHQPAKAREHYLKVLESDPRNPQATAIRYWLTDNPL